MHSVHNGQCPAYLRHTVLMQSPVIPIEVWPIRSVASKRYFIPRCGERAFRVAGPRTWNDLPSQLHTVADFWATVCKTVRPMLSDCCPDCLSCLSVTLVYCGQTVGSIKTKLDMEVSLGPGHIALDGDPATPPLKGHSPQFSAHVCCG